MAGKEAGPATHGQVWRHLSGGQGGRSVEAQAHLPHGPATSLSEISCKYLDTVQNVYIYTRSLQCFNSERLETNVRHQGSDLCTVYGISKLQSTIQCLKRLREVYMLTPTFT